MQTTYTSIPKPVEDIQQNTRSDKANKKLSDNARKLVILPDAPLVACDDVDYYGYGYTLYSGRKYLTAGSAVSTTVGGFPVTYTYEINPTWGCASLEVNTPGMLCYIIEIYIRNL